jgi:hypothetical protein
MTENNDITIKFSKDEALVLFEFLSRFNAEDRKDSFQDQAEEKILWVIEGQLEKLFCPCWCPS